MRDPENEVGPMLEDRKLQYFKLRDRLSNQKKKTKYTAYQLNTVFIFISL